MYQSVIKKCKVEEVERLISLFLMIIPFLDSVESCFLLLIAWIRGVILSEKCFWKVILVFLRRRVKEFIFS